MYYLTERGNRDNHLPKETSIKTGFRNWMREGSTQTWAFTFGFLLITALAMYAIMFGTRDAAQAQSPQLPPQFNVVIFDGRVTVAGSPFDLQGLMLYAKVGDWLSDPVTIGDGTHDLNEFEDLNVRPPDELLGQEVKFLLGGTVEATTSDYYAVVTPDGRVLTDTPIGFPIFRTVLLDFPSLPEATTPTPVPSDNQASGPAVTIFSGQAFTQGSPVPDGYQVFAVVGDTLRTNNVTVLEGEYSLAVSTENNSLNGSLIKFFLIDKGDPTNPGRTLEAETPSVFNVGQSSEVRIVFPALAPTPTPVPPTATPVPPTATPVPPTATPIPPTATPVPPTATPVPPTATPIPPTATPVPPTATPVPPTATPVPPTATPVPPTATPVPPTATPIPPTATPVPPTATPVPPTVAPESEDTGGGFNATVPLAIVLILLLIAIAAYFGWRYTQLSKQQT